MPRGKSTNVYMVCKVCNMQNYTTRINKRTTPKLERSRDCDNCNKHTMHKNSSEIKHSS